MSNNKNEPFSTLDGSNPPTKPFPLTPVGEKPVLAGTENITPDPNLPIPGSQPITTPPPKLPLSWQDAFEVLKRIDIIQRESPADFQSLVAFVNEKFAKIRAGR